jgi:hypothetical protein
MREHAMMMGRKVLTLACAAGILACGACFLPPLPAPKPAPPPLVLNLQSIHTIRLEMVNEPGADHLDVAGLATQVANLISDQSLHRVKAYVSKQDGDGDAVLRILITNENATLDATPGSPDQWDFEIGTSATLTRADGTNIWTEKDGEISFLRSFTQPHPADLWSDPEVHERVRNRLSNKIVYPMLYGH